MSERKKEMRQFRSWLFANPQDNCVFCGRNLKRTDGTMIGYNNPEPIIDDAKAYCCDTCNDKYVILARLGELPDYTETPRGTIRHGKAGYYFIKG